MRVLVVEDDDAVRHVIDRILTRQGHHTLIAPSAFQANAMLLDFPDPPDIALLDVVLPHVDGIAFADELQQRYSAIRLVFITGWLDSARTAAATKRGTLLLKPFTPGSLLTAIAGR